MRLFRQLCGFCREVVMNWITFGLFATSLPQLFEFLPTSDAKAAQDWIAATIGPRITFWAALFGIFIAAFLAWKSQDDRLESRISPVTLSTLVALFTQAGDLFERPVASTGDFGKWKSDFEIWYTKTYETIRGQISEMEAALFKEPPGGALMNCRGNFGREHNDMLNTLMGYQENLRKVLERYAHVGIS